MSWFNNKKAGGNVTMLPDLPQLPELPEPSMMPKLKKNIEPAPLPQFEVQVEDLPELPEPRLPEAPSKLSQNDFENIVDLKPRVQSLPKPVPQVNLPKQPLEQMQKSNFSYEPEEIEEYKPKPLPKVDSSPRTLEISTQKIERFTKPVTKKSEPIFIRLDKFESTVENFEAIKEKIDEIEDLLNKTRELKAKEEEELSEWEKEIQIIKARIDSIDKNLLNKLD